MSAADIVGLILSALAAIAGLLSLIFFLIDRRRSRKTLLVTVEPVPVQSTPDGELSLRVDGRPLEHPTLVIVRMQSTSKRDISTSTFDAGRRLTIDFGVNLVSVFSKAGSIGYEIDGQRLLIPPQLIQYGNALRLGLVLEGDFQKAKLERPVLINADTPVRMYADVERARTRRRRTWQVSTVVLIALLAASAAVANGSNFVPPPGYGLSDGYQITYPGTYAYTTPSRSAEVVMPFLNVGSLVDVECVVSGDIVSVHLPYVGARSSDMWVRTNEGVYIPVIYLDGYGSSRRLEPPRC